MGRFVSEDGWQGDPFQPQTLNKYRYALNNPVLLTDPSGNCEIACWTVIILISLAVAGCSDVQISDVTYPYPTATNTPPERWGVDTIEGIAEKYSVSLPNGVSWDYIASPVDLLTTDRATWDFPEQGKPILGIGSTGDTTALIGMPGVEYTTVLDNEVYITEAGFAVYNGDELSVASLMVHEARHAWIEYASENYQTLVSTGTSFPTSFKDFVQLRNGNSAQREISVALDEYEAARAQMSFLESQGASSSSAYGEAQRNQNRNKDYLEDNFPEYLRYVADLSTTMAGYP